MYSYTFLVTGFSHGVSEVAAVMQSATGHRDCFILNWLLFSTDDII